MNIQSYILEVSKIFFLQIFKPERSVSKAFYPGMRIRFWPRKRIRGSVPQTKWRFLKVYKTNILDNIKSLLFCFHTFGVRRTIDVLDSENQPGPGQIRN